MEPYSFHCPQCSVQPAANICYLWKPLPMVWYSPNLSILESTEILNGHHKQQRHHGWYWNLQQSSIQWFSRKKHKTNRRNSDFDLKSLQCFQYVPICPYSGKCIEFVTCNLLNGFMSIMWPIFDILPILVELVGIDLDLWHLVSTFCTWETIF